MSGAATATSMATDAALAALLLCACGESPAPPSVEGSLFASEPDLQWRLPAPLREISGLAVSPDGRLFAHDDETAAIYEIDMERSSLVKIFTLGDPVLTGDFEALAITPAGDFWLASSMGELYRFHEGADGDHVRFERFDSGADDFCAIEGLAYLSAEDRLILACKRNKAPGMGDAPTLLSWSPGGAAEEWRRAGEDFAAAAGVSRFQPSSVELDTQSGRIIVLSANDAALVELDADGALRSARALVGAHPQPEALAVMPDGSMIIADEGGDGQALLSRYPRVP